MRQPILLAALLMAPALAVAGVSPQNGNFYITYQDITQKTGDHELNLRRTYNSNSADSGWFGFGWGTPYETRLLVMPDGSAVVLENGSGSTTNYRPKVPADISGGVTRIVEAMAKRDNMSSDALPALRKQLTGNEELRQRKVLQYDVRSELPAGAALQGNRCSADVVVRSSEGYKRTTCERANDYFDLQGRLVRQEDSDGQVINVHYDGTRPSRIADSHGQVLNFSWTTAGHLATVTTNGKQRANYRYSDSNDLIESVDGKEMKTVYEYQGNHNLANIRYLDTSTMRIEYVSAESGRVRSVTERTGEKTVYEYGLNSQDGSIAWATVTTTPLSGEARVRKYAYTREPTETGGERLARVSSTGGRNNLDTAFDAKGRVVRRTDGQGRVVEYVYHPRTDKLILVLSDRERRQFRYDNEGKLTHAESSDGQVIELDYGNTSHIQRLVESNRDMKDPRELRFAYNAAGKPTEITLVGTGKVNVRYDNKGEITDVSSAKGSKMALNVTQVFQSLLRVIKISGMHASM